MSLHSASNSDANGALPVDLDYVPEWLKIRAKTELSEDENKRTECLKLLRSKLKEEHGLLWQDDDLFLLSFLRARKFDVDRAFNLIKGFYNNLGKHGYLYYNITFDRLKVLMETQLLTFLPYRDREGSVVFVYRCTGWDPQQTKAQEHILCNGIGMMQALRSPATQIAGFQLIADMKGYSMKYLMYTTPSVMRFFADMIQGALPVRMRGFHVVNGSHIASYLWPLVRMFLSKKLRDRIHIHGEDLKSLHEFFLPSILPADLGGDLPPYDNADWRQRMEASSDYIMNLLSHGYEKHLKQWKKINPSEKQ